MMTLGTLDSGYDDKYAVKQTSSSKKKIHRTSAISSRQAEAKSGESSSAKEDLSTTSQSNFTFKHSYCLI